MSPRSLRGLRIRGGSSCFPALLVGLAVWVVAGPCAVATPQASPSVKQHMPTPWPRRAEHALADPVAMNAACEGCHADVALQWRESLHADAYTNDAFQRALAVEPLAFCRGCHAPEANPLKAADGALQGIGVACVSCHVVGGSILAAPGERPQTTHAVLRSPAFASSAACAGCHEFAFPGQNAAAGGELMQSTISEHRASDSAQLSCADCHMPRDASGRRSHRFDVTRNKAVLKAALRVVARRLSGGRIELDLTSQGVGHAFPTGDLFRRIRVRAEAIGPEYSSLAAAEAYLTRSFVAVRSAEGASHRSVANDTRLPATGAQTQRITLELTPEAAQYPIHYWVTYERVAHPGKVSGPEAQIEGSVELAAGTLPIEVE